MKQAGEEQQRNVLFQILQPVLKTPTLPKERNPQVALLLPNYRNVL
jgi:hypothetical protein